MNIEYTRKAIKDFESIDFKTKRRILQAIRQMPNGDIKPIKGVNNPPLQRLRIGKYRVLFHRPSDDEILIVKIGARGDVYK